MPDGTCRYGCDPALRRPAHRALMVGAAQKKHDRQRTTIGLSIDKVREAAARVVPELSEMAMRSDFRLQRRKRRYGV